MSNAVQKKSTLDVSQFENLIIHGDLSKLSSDQRLSYYRYRCESLGLDPLSRPFDYLTLSGKTVLYPNRGGVEQLRRNNNISIIVTDKVMANDIYTVFVRATTPDGRTEDECGAVALKGASGEALANLQMKAMTKAKRRATISICGLGMQDETEIESIPGARTISAAEIDPHPVKAVKEEPAVKVVEPLRDLSQFVVSSGAFAGKRLMDRPMSEWKTYCDHVKEKLASSEFPKEMRKDATELVQTIEEYIHSQK